MSTTIEATALHERDLFELPGGSVYETARRPTGDDHVQARLWCAHPPDVATGAPPQVTFHPQQVVGLLSHAETRPHVGHSGYVRTVFEQEMDRRHQALMSVAYEKLKREATATRQAAHARRSWWQKLFR